MNIQWYPGHMAKTRKLIKENLKLVDIVIEVVDARIPESSRNPDFNNIIGNKPRLLIMNKSDLSDEKVNYEWNKWFLSNNIRSVLVNSLTGKGLNNICNICKDILKDKLERQKSKGIIGRSIRMMVVGIPNVGKSAFINKFTGKASAKTGNKPGVTRGKQWIRVKNGYELLDTPGILWPKFQNPNVGINLAYTGAIKDQIINVEEIACSLLEFLNNNYSDNLIKRYKLDNIEGLSGFELLTYIGKKRGCIISGGEIDTLRAANIVLDEFRAAKIGKISLERPSH